MNGELRCLVLLAAAVGLALACAPLHPRTLRWVWPAAACLTGTLLGVSATGVMLVTLAAAVLTWPARRAWA